VSGLEKEFEGRVRGVNADATTPEGKKAVKSLGFETHGLAIRSADGRALWKQPDHEVRVEDVRKALRELLEKRNR